MDRCGLILIGVAALAAGCASPVFAPAPLPQQGDDRLLFAQAHLELRPALAAQHFDCAVGARLTARPLPALTRALERVAVEAVRDVPAPTRSVDAGQVCARLFPGEGASGETSRRAALARAYGLVLAELAPDRSEAVGRRARDVAEAERLCGLADAAAIDRGWVAGTDAFSRMQADAAFGELLSQAAEEVARARRDPIESPACAAERRSLSPLPV